MTLHAFKPHAEPDAFDRFWACYPRREARKDALKAWSHLNPSPTLVSTILQHVLLRSKTKQWRDDKRFIPLPATFLRGERWEDEIDESDFYQARL